jgi:hypothetical protein
LVIAFKQTAPSKLYWAGRPAMRIVQALHWLKDTLPSDRGRIMSQLATLLADGRYGRALRDDLRTGLPTLPAWMQDIARELLSVHDARASTPASRRPKSIGQRVSSRPPSAPVQP